MKPMSDCSRESNCNSAMMMIVMAVTAVSQGCQAGRERLKRRVAQCGDVISSQIPEQHQTMIRNSNKRAMTLAQTGTSETDCCSERSKAAARSTGSHQDLCDVNHELKMRQVMNQCRANRYTSEGVCVKSWSGSSVSWFDDRYSCCMLTWLSKKCAGMLVR